MGKKISLKLDDQEKEKTIKIRENLTINNLKAIIIGVLKLKKENIKIIHNRQELTGHRKLSDSGLEDGEKIEII